MASELPAALFTVWPRSCSDWANNGHLLADVVRLGYIDLRDDLVVDVTYGEGSWWTVVRPHRFVAHDLYKGDGVDFRSLPEASGSVDVVAFDPPYMERSPSSSTVPGFDQRYGLDTTAASYPELVALIEGGLVECARVVRPGGFVLVKCMPYQSGRRFRPMPYTVAVFAEGLGLDLDDELVMRRELGPGDESSTRSRRNDSRLLVFRKRQRRPRAGTTAATHTFATAVARAKEARGG